MLVRFRVGGGGACYFNCKHALAALKTMIATNTEQTLLFLLINNLFPQSLIMGWEFLNYLWHSVNNLKEYKMRVYELSWVVHRILPSERDLVSD